MKLSALRLSGRIVAAGLFAAVAALILVPRPPAFTAADRTMPYARVVDRLFQDGILEGGLDRERAPRVRITDTCRKDESCYKTLRGFAINSYLRDDIRRADPTTWKTQGSKVTGLRPTARLFADNDEERVEVPPRLLYTPAEDLSKRDTDIRIQAVNLSNDRTCELASDSAGLLTSDCPAFADTCGLRLVPRDDKGTRRYGLALTQRNCGHLFIDDKPASSSHTIDQGSVVRIEPIGAGQPVHMLVAGKSDVMAATDSLGIAFYDHGFAGLSAYLQQAAPTVMLQLKPSSDIRLSLVRPLNLRTNAVLQDHLRSKGGNLSAGATIMDGVTGEVVALPSFPFAPEDLAASGLSSADQAAILDDNINFHDLTIGSAAKVPFATAIASRWPGLLTMEVQDGDSRVGRVLGYDLDIESHAHPGRTDFTGFIAQSSNRYAMTLMAFGLRKGEPAACKGSSCRAVSGEQGIWLDGRAVTRVPAASLRNPDVGGEWRSNLSGLFDIAPDYCFGEPRSERMSLWGSQRLGAAYELNSPPLCLSNVQSPTPDYYMSVLGGSRSLWSTLLVAQTYGRIVSNQRLETTLLARDSFRAGHHRRPFPALGLKPEVYQAVRTGMQQTISAPRGTARALATGTLCGQTTDDGLYHYQCYAKTGTGRVRIGQDTHSLALIVEKVAIKAPTALCTRSVFAINFQYRTRENATPAIAYGADLLKDKQVRRWIDRSCTAETD